MSAIGDCCRSCPPFTPPVNIPGSPGDPGTPGTNGVNAFSVIEASGGIGFTVPAVNASAKVYITDTGEWMGLGQPVYISGAGQYQVSATVSTDSGGNFVQVKNLGSSGNAVPGSVISSGNEISPSGLQGNNAFSVTTATFSWTTFGTSSTITITGQGNTVAWMQPGQIVFVQGAGYFQVNGSPNVVNGTASLTLLNYAGNSQNGSVASGAGVSPGGVQGSLPLPSPQNFFSNSLSVNLTSSMTNIGSAQVTLPAAGTWLIFTRLVVKPFVENAASGPPAISAQVEVQPGGSGGFSPLTNSVTTVTFGSPGSSNITQGYNTTTPPVIYTTATIGDVVGLFAQYNTAGTSTMIVGEAAVVAICLNLTT